MEFKLLNNSIIASQDDKGGWVYKSNETQGPFKKNGNLKAEYKEQPAFKVIIEYEGQEVKDYEDSLSLSIKEVASKLLSFSK